VEIGRRGGTITLAEELDLVPIDQVASEENVQVESMGCSLQATPSVSETIFLDDLKDAKPVEHISPFMEEVFIVVA
jgi:hypothetical protein